MRKAPRQISQLQTSSRLHSTLLSASARRSAPPHPPPPQLAPKLRPQLPGLVISHTCHRSLLQQTTAQRASAAAAAMSAPKIKLESVVNDQSPDAAQARKIVAIFDSDFNVVDPTELSAERTASAIDDLFKAEHARDQGEEAVEGFFWNLWTTLLEVVKLVPATDARMHHLADVLAALHGKKTADVEIWDEKMAVWEDLPILGPQMREAWNMCPKYDGTDNDALLQGWISLNSFAARTLYFRPNAYNLGIWQLRSALEEPLPEKPTAQHTQLAAACEWITHAGKQLHSLSTQGSADERTIQITKAGSQFPGSGGPSQERWQFWKSRLTSLKCVVTSEGLKERIEGVVEIMNDMEK